MSQNKKQRSPRRAGLYKEECYIYEIKDTYIAFK
ncbi:MAG: hypothetical protein JWR12_989 [Mucilaginibacter sp.]|nr:hypothetical protein [Mucilaginibacter sp.]